MADQKNTDKRGPASGQRPAAAHSADGARPVRPEPARRAQEIGRVQGARRRRRAGNYLFYYILLGVILTIVTVTLSLTVFFNIAAINVSGSSIYSTEQILAALDAREGNNLLRLNTKKIADKALESLTAAESVEVTRHFPDQLDVIVTDGDPNLQISIDGLVFYQFTESGRLVAVSDTAVTDAQVVVGPDPSGLQVGEFLSALGSEQQATFSYWRTIRDELYNYSIADISAMDLSNEVNLKIYYQNRIEITIGTLTDMDAKMSTLKAILYDSGAIGADETGTIDLSDPDRVYFNNQASCSLPTGAGQAGWSWSDPYSETLEQALYQSAEPDPVPEANTDENGEEGENENGSEDGSAEGGSEDTSEEGPSEEATYETSGGMRLPQLPTIGGSSASSSSQGVSQQEASSADSAPAASLPEAGSSSEGDAASGDSQSTAGPSIPSPSAEEDSASQAGAAGGGSTGGGVGTQAPSVPSISH